MEAGTGRALSRAREDFGWAPKGRISRRPARPAGLVKRLLLSSPAECVVFLMKLLLIEPQGNKLVGGGPRSEAWGASEVSVSVGGRGWVFAPPGGWEGEGDQEEKEVSVAVGPRQEGVQSRDVTEVNTDDEQKSLRGRGTQSRKLLGLRPAYRPALTCLGTGVQFMQGLWWRESGDGGQGQMCQTERGGGGGLPGRAWMRSVGDPFRSVPHSVFPGRSPRRRGQEEQMLQRRGGQGPGTADGRDEGRARGFHAGRD